MIDERVVSSNRTHPTYDVKMTRYGLLLLAICTAFLEECENTPPQPALTPDTVDMQSLQPDEIHCRTIASERAYDALANGYGFSVEDRVHQKTYDDCMAWRTRNKPE